MTDTPKRGRGRPKKPDDQKHPHQIKLMLTNAQLALYESLEDDGPDMLRAFIDKIRS